ncbi:predicted protein [Plenodomus lingam JN3]|uniref:Predicted protein n=1 Tax=Leptosphaeria maculans (strain JN3 / isolate v23.1.3 / race Av1-4-5-6-7-8) TaxID=985895 RepID=E4ZS53_LEPMJ|nr:predicted protein [Plenodomus lingam JN3]CBX94233.1 predicted protein [Plenodomus lingam JN3]
MLPYIQKVPSVRCMTHFACAFQKKQATLIYIKVRLEKVYAELYMFQMSRSR